MTQTSIWECVSSCATIHPCASHIPDNDVRENYPPSLLTEFAVHNTNGYWRIIILCPSDKARAR